MTYNISDLGPDPHSQKPAILYSNIAAIALYLSNNKVDINNKRKLQTDITEDISIKL